MQSTADKMSRDQKMSEEQEQYNRLFVLGGKECSDDEFRTAFGKYGEVKDIWRVKDRKSGDDKGVTYVTYSKASEAALSIEEMNGRMIGNSPKPLKVIMANSRREGNVRDPKETEKMLRLFLVVPKTYSKDDIREKFEEYGSIEYIRLITDRKTGDRKGLAYVKFHRAYHAALALEQCDPSFKAVFAAPKENIARDSWGGDQHWSDRSSARSTADDWGSYSGGGNDRYAGDRYAVRADTGYGGYGSGGARGSLMGAPSLGVQGAASGALQSFLNYPNTGEKRLEVVSSPTVDQDQIYKLFDLVPGLEYCELDSSTGITYVQYSTPQAAAYCKEKMTHLEYPPGFRLAIRYPLTGHMGNQGEFGNQQSSLMTATASSLNASLQTVMQGGDVSGNLNQLVESIQKATTLLQQAGLAGGGGTDGGANKEDGQDEMLPVRYCNVSLPTTKPFASRDSPCVERLFIVSQPEACPQHILQDALCRFGGLIDAFFMPGKNFGYAKFASKEGADAAIQTLHQQMICGMRVKVMQADPPKFGEEDDSSRAKRMKTS